MLFNRLLVQVSIRNANVHDCRFNKGLYIKYKPFKETEFTTTKTVKDTLSPEFDEKDSKVFGFDSVKQELLDWFDSGCITFQLMGRQEDSDPDSSRKRMTTKVCVTHSCFASLFGGLRDDRGHSLARMAYFARTFLKFDVCNPNQFLTKLIPFCLISSYLGLLYCGRLLFLAHYRAVFS